VTIIVSVKINDGIVMAADSAGTMPSGQVYLHATKITNLCEGLPVGAMSTGAGGIGNESVETLLKDLRRRFAGRDPAHADWQLDPERYTMEQVAGRLRAFLFEEKAAPCPEPTNLQLRLCGYSASRPLAEVWEVSMTGQECPPPRRIMDETRACKIDTAGEVSWPLARGPAGRSVTAWCAPGCHPGSSEPGAQGSWPRP
jgi:hypothetical protein